MRKPARKAKFSYGIHKRKQKSEEERRVDLEIWVQKKLSNHDHSHTLLPYKRKQKSEEERRVDLEIWVQKKRSNHAHLHTLLPYTIHPLPETEISNNAHKYFIILCDG